MFIEIPPLHLLSPCFLWRRWYIPCERLSNIFLRMIYFQCGLITLFVLRLAKEMEENERSPVLVEMFFCIDNDFYCIFVELFMLDWRKNSISLIFMTVFYDVFISSFPVSYNFCVLSDWNVYWFGKKKRKKFCQLNRIYS